MQSPRGPLDSTATSATCQTRSTVRFGFAIEISRASVQPSGVCRIPPLVEHSAHGCWRLSMGLPLAGSSENDHLSHRFFHSLSHPKHNKSYYYTRSTQPLSNTLLTRTESFQLQIIYALLKRYLDTKHFIVFKSLPNKYETFIACHMPKLRKKNLP